VWLDCSLFGRNFIPETIWTQILYDLHASLEPTSINLSEKQPNAQRFNLKNIRILLTEGFIEEELRRLCFDELEFRPIYEQLAPGIGKDKVIDKLIEYAERRELIEKLLALAKECSYTKYEKHQPYYVTISPIRSSNAYDPTPGIQPNLTTLDFSRFLKRFSLDQPSKQIILLLDEFELIFEDYDQNSRDFLEGLRAMSLMPENNLVIVTATRAPLFTVCAPFGEDTGLEFHNNFYPYELELFDEEETRFVVNTLLAKTNIEFTPQELDYVWQIGQLQDKGASPILVQIAASTIFDHKTVNNDPINYLDLKHEFERQARKFRL
jgi:hypothetical protein